MKYFSPSYWLKMWVLSAPLFNDKTQGVYAKSINNKNIKDWASENTKGISVLEQQESNFTNSTEFLNYQTHLDAQNWAKNLSQDTSTDSSWNLEARPKNDQQATLWEHEFEEQHHHDLQAEHNRHKRVPNQNNWKYNLNIPLFRQETSIWCAVACVEAILRYLGVKTNSLLKEVNKHRKNEGEYTSFQSYLANRISSSTSQNTYRILNEIINEAIPPRAVVQYSLESFWQVRYFNSNPNVPFTNSINSNYNSWIQQFHNAISISLPWLEEQVRTLPYLPHLDTSSTEVCALINEFAILKINEVFANEFYRNLYQIVISSLSSNLPLIFCQSFDPAISPIVTGHAILIVDVSSDNITPETDFSQIRYRVIDPATEQYATYTANDLYMNNGEVSSLISYNPHNIRLQSIQFVSLDEHDPSFLELDWSIVLNIITKLQRDIAFRIFFAENSSCENREKRDLKNPHENILNSKYCVLKSELDKIEGRITIIKILDEHTKGGHLKEGDMYVGTTKGIYLIYDEKRIGKFNKLNFPITSIELDGNGSAYVTNEQGEIYHLNLFGWGSKKMEKMESFNLKNEIRLYYWPDKSIGTVEYDWWNYGANEYNRIWKQFDLYAINPLNYKKIEFLGNNTNFETIIQWGKEQDHGGKANKFNGNKLSDLMINQKILGNSARENFKINVQPKYDWYWNCCSGITYYQILGLTFYWEKENYYLQLLALQYANSWGSAWGGSAWMNIGNGIRLYNEEVTENQIPRPRPRKNILEETKSDEKKYNNQTSVANELQNTMQWDKNITNLSNHEQHLPNLNNQSSYANNNNVTTV